MFNLYQHGVSGLAASTQQSLGFAQTYLGSTTLLLLELDLTWEFPSRQLALGDDIEGAAAALWEALADCDGPSSVMAARARRYAEDPPSEDWDGVFVMAEK
jgi:hypothetical protein